MRYFDFRVERCEILKGHRHNGDKTPEIGNIALAAVTGYCEKAKRFYRKKKREISTVSSNPDMLILPKIETGFLVCLKVWARPLLTAPRINGDRYFVSKDKVFYSCHSAKPDFILNRAVATFIEKEIVKFCSSF